MMLSTELKADDATKRAAVFDPNFTIAVGYGPGMKP
jgi:hypothetical protein